MFFVLFEWRGWRPIQITTCATVQRLGWRILTTAHQGIVVVESGVFAHHIVVIVVVAVFVKGHVYVDATVVDGVIVIGVVIVVGVVEVDANRGYDLTGLAVWIDFNFDDVGLRLQTVWFVATGQRDHAVVAAAD